VVYIILAIDDLLVDARGRARTIDRRPADLIAMEIDVDLLETEARVVVTDHGRSRLASETETERTISALMST
jgi:hypothetical protein